MSTYYDAIREDLAEVMTGLFGPDLVVTFDESPVTCKEIKGVIRKSRTCSSGAHNDVIMFSLQEGS